MNRTTFGRKTFVYFKALCFVGLLTVPSVARASEINLTAKSGVYSLAAKNSTVRQVFSYIERHSKYVFVYDQRVKSLLSQKVNITIKGKSVEAILADVCRQIGLTYHINDRQVSIMAKTSTTDNETNLVKRSMKKITGTITDEHDEPLIGATIKVRGTNLGTVTDINGNYSIEAAPGSILEISYIGYNPKEVKIGPHRSYNVNMSEDNNTLDELVVVGYGTMKKSDLTGGLANIGSKELDRVASFSLMDKIASQIPGLNITTGNAAPGAEHALLIRGQNSISADNSPLIVLDGIPYNGALSDIDPNTIESMSVLKDASASAIYGSRGANGIILIQSKHGQKSAPHVSYKGTISLSEPQHRVDVMDGAQYIKLKQDIARFKDGWTGDQLVPENILSASELVNYKKGVTTDWQDIIFRTAFSHNHQVSLSGGTDFTTYSAALAYLNQQGVLYNSRMERYNLDLSVTQVLNKWLTIGVNTKFIHKETGGITPNIEHAVKQSPYGIFKDENGDYYEEPMDQSLIKNPMVNVNADQDNTGRNFFVNSYANILLPLEGLSFRTNFGYDYRSIFVGTYYGRDTFNGKSVNGKASINNTHYWDYTWENILKYNRTFGKHNIDLTGMYSVQKTQSKKSGESAETFVNDDSSYSNIGAGENNKSLSSSLSETSMLSYMFRVNYGYDNRYLLTVTGRSDGFSSFGKNNKYAFFPSLAVAWNLHQEKFMANTRNWLDQAKIRISYGSNGNQAISPYQTLDRLHLFHYIWGDGGTPVNAVYLANDGIGNPNLKWETTNTFNVGIDFSFLGNRIYGSIDAYMSNTKDLLMRRTVPIMNGFGTIMDNIGKTKNKGIEIVLNTVNIKRPDFQWNSSVNFSLNRDKIVDLRGDKKDDITNKWFIGKPIQVYYDYKVGGIWQESDQFTTTDANGKTIEIQKGAKPGTYKLVDTNRDGVINSKDKVIIGSKRPSFRMAMSNDLTYKNFYFSCLVSGTFNVWRELNEANVGSWTFSIYNYLKDANYWTPETPDAKYAAPGATNFDGHSYYHKFTYIQIKNITLGYNLDHSLLNKLHLTGASINLSVNNAWTFCDIHSVLNYDSSWFASYPTARSYVLGLNLTF